MADSYQELGSQIVQAAGAIGMAIGSNDGFDIKDYRKQLKEDKAYQKEMMQFQNNETRDLTLWNNEQNKELKKYYYDNYDSPEATMKGYAEAGINPNLVAGRVTGNDSALSSVSSSASAPSTNSSGAYQSAIAKKQLKLQALSMGQDAMLKQSQIASLQSQIGYQNAQTEYQNAMTEGVILDNEKKRVEKPYWEQNASQQARSFMLANNLSEKEIEQFKVNIDKTYAEINSMHILDNKTVEEINNLLKQRDFITASTDEKRKLIQKYEQDRKVGIAMVGLIGAQEKVQVALESLTNEQKEEVIQKVTNLKTVDDINGIQKQLQQHVLTHQDRNGAYSAILDAIGAVAAFIPLAPGQQRQSTQYKYTNIYNH